MGQVEVISPGIYSSIQDAGRVGYAHFGIPKSGALDQQSMRRANAILGNELDAPVLEITFSGPRLRFSAAVNVVISGAEWEVFINGELVKIDEIISIPANGLLAFGQRGAGVRSYLAIAGGFQTEKLLGSYSWSRQLVTPFRLNKRMKLNYSDVGRRATGFTPDRTELETEEFEVIPGPEFDWLTDEQQKQLFNQTYQLRPNSDRMAFSFESAAILPFKEQSFLTAPVLPGVVQWYPNGQLVLLHREAQRTGGYPRILIFKEEALNQIAQKEIGIAIGLREG